MADEKYQDELENVIKQLKQIDTDMRILSERRERLRSRKEFLTDHILMKKSKEAGEDDRWNHTNFSWSSTLQDVLRKTFKLDCFRSNQLAAMNATLSKQDLILIMPTGGGKSLCYQLPALINIGFTLVVSPMLSLIEDQVMQLKSLNVSAEMLHTSTKDDMRVQQMMVDQKSGLKLLYVTPEKLAKSKRFMSKLQKSYGMRLLSRIAIDEVHCCSEWGHDFRTDYQFLSVLKGMFPDVPIIGVTATATSKVILDVQKILMIQGCLILKSPFNRPNIYYEVREKPSTQKECLDLIENLLKQKFKNQSGIIYTTTIKDCDELAEELRKRGCSVGGYHAQLGADKRSHVHKKWLSGTYQAVVATIAFGLGIDKPDVRFVIHHSLSKSMENFYQESGRAGRDGKKATSIILYRFADIFKLSIMVFTQKTGIQKLYSVVNYCLNLSECRRKLIASHFDEEWESTNCMKMCDHCRSPREVVNSQINDSCRTLFKILDIAKEKDIRLTAQMVIDVWFGKANKLKTKVCKPPSFSNEFAGNIIAFLLMNDYLKEDFHFTPYSTISYLKKGAKASEDYKKEGIQMPIFSQKNSSQHSEREELKRKRTDSSDSFQSNNKRKVFQIDSSSSEEN